MDGSGYSNPPAGRLDAQGDLASRESEMGDAPGSPTWPIPTPGAPAHKIPPVGLNWGVVGRRLNADPRVLQHDGAIVLAGEYFVEAGYFIDPSTMRARHVDVGDMALNHGYFLGELSISEFQIELEEDHRLGPPGLPVVPDHRVGPIIGLFMDQLDAERARRKIVRGSLGSGVTREPGPLGVELRVPQVELGGRVATIITAHGGAVLSIGGKPVAVIDQAPLGNVAAPRHTGFRPDAFRGGTGVSTQSERTPDVPEGR